jgi:WXXGXW repeat (2 copies)
MRLSHYLFLAVLVLIFSAAASAQIGVSITIAPPALPVYEQPPCPAEGYMWTPGYWAYDNDYDDYYWVPGTWVLAPEPGLFWTPPYWGWNGAAFVFYDGYWGPHVGFYGGINYGFGFFGEGYQGGRWQNGQFFYNTTVNNVSVTNIHNTYNTTVINNTTVVNHVSYNGGQGGVTARPSAQDEEAAHDRHVPPVAAQTQHIQAARTDPQMRASANHGKPPVAATAKPGELRGSGVVAAKEAGAPYHPPANRGAAEKNNNAAAERNNNKETAEHNNETAARPEDKSKPAVHPNDLSPLEKPAAPSGNSKADQKYQQQQQKLYAKQQQDRENLQKKQDQEHQRQAQQKASDAQKQQLEQKHQQQTQQMVAKHQQEQQKLQRRAPGGGNPHPETTKK